MDSSFRVVISTPFVLRARSLAILGFPGYCKRVRLTPRGDGNGDTHVSVRTADQYRWRAGPTKVLEER